MPAVEITGGLPPCARDHQAVVLSCSHLARRQAVSERLSTWLVVDVEACSRETHSPSRAPKIYGGKEFQITRLHMSLLPTVIGATLHYLTPHMLLGWAVELTSALTVADAAVTIVSEMT